MKHFCYLIAILIFNLSSLVLSAEIASESSGKFSQKEVILSDNSKISTFTSEGTFKNNLGNYGSITCIGFIERKSDGEVTNLQNICETLDQNGIKVWSRGKRSKSGIQAGVGSSYIVDTTNPHKNLLIGTECKYAVNYVRDLFFAKSICKINDEAFQKLKN